MTISLVLFSARHCLFPARFRLAYYRALLLSHSLLCPLPPLLLTVFRQVPPLFFFPSFQPSRTPCSFSSRSQPASFRLSTPRLRPSTNRVSIRRRLSLPVLVVSTFHRLFCLWQLLGKWSPLYFFLRLAARATSELSDRSAEPGETTRGIRNRSSFFSFTRTNRYLLPRLRKPNFHCSDRILDIRVTSSMLGERSRERRRRSVFGEETSCTGPRRFDAKTNIDTAPEDANCTG